MHSGNKKHHGRILLISGVVIVATVVGLRMNAAWSLRHEATDSGITTVSVIKPAASSATEEIILPGNIQAWHDAPVYARTNGYLKSWKVDIGAKVTAGDVLAEIDAPEIDAQLRQAEADVKTAEAGKILAQSTATRWKTLLKTDSVSKQEAEEKISDAAAKSASLLSALANRDRLRELASFKRVVAPFNGTITARNTDIGALINSGSSSDAGKELFHIADTDHLRIYVQVPQNYAGNINRDVTTELRLAEHPGKTYAAKLRETANALDPASRTLLVQLETDNHNGELLAGGYTEVHLKLHMNNGNIRLPVNTLIFRSEGLQVATVNAENHVVLKPIVMGRDYGNEVEVRSGITPEDTVIINPPDSLTSGMQVHAITVQPKKDEKKS